MALYSVTSHCHAGIFVMRRSMNHVLVQLVTLISLIILVGVVLFTMDPWMNSDLYHYFALNLPSLSIQFDSLVVDHLAVFAVISPPFIGLLLVHVTCSHLHSRLEIALLLLRVASCLTIFFAVTVLLNEFLSRRAMLALGIVLYASLGLLYSYMVPIYQWYSKEVYVKGVVTILPSFLQELLLHTSLLEWLTDTTLSDKLAPFLPFLLPLSKAEQMRLMEQLPPKVQLMLTKPGLVSLFPTPVQTLLLPEKRGHGSDNAEEVISNDVTITDQKSHDKNEGEGQEVSLVATSGFDFHRPNVVNTLQSREQTLHDIMTSRLWKKCIDVMQLPRASTLNRTAAVSSAFLVMQFYASKRSRRVFLYLMHFVVSSALTSVACGAIFLRLAQLLDIKWPTMPLVRYTTQYLLQNGRLSTPIRDLPATKKSVTLRTAASSVSVVMAALYIIRRMRH